MNDLPKSEPVPALASGDLLGWLRGKLAEAEKKLNIREEMAAVWRTGTNAEWKAAAAMHPSTAGQELKRPYRLKQAVAHDIIAERLRRDVGMFRATLDALSPPNDSDAHAQKSNQPDPARSGVGSGGMVRSPLLFKSEIRYLQRLDFAKTRLAAICRELGIPLEGAQAEIERRASLRTKTQQTKDPIALTDELYADMCAERWPNGPAETRRTEDTK
jgi:hypothetical protein